MKQTRVLVIALPLLLACAACGPDAGGGNHAPSGARPPDATVALPGGGSGVNFDDLFYDASADRLVSAARGTDLVDVVDPVSLAIQSAASDSASAASGGGWVYALRRGARVVDVIDPATQQVVASEGVTGEGLDYLRYVGSRNELWVTEPGTGMVEILTLGSAATPSPAFAAFVETPGGPEGITIDEDRGRAWVHLFGGDLVGIDLVSRAVVDSIPTGCSHSHGFPAVVPGTPWVLATCRTPEIHVIDVDAGEEVDSYALPGAGEALPAFSGVTGHAYLRADPGETVAVLTISSDGSLVHEGDFAATMDGHCLAADAHGSLWVCDADGGTLLKFDDPF